MRGGGRDRQAVVFLEQYAGQVAGVATSFLWAVTSMSFAAAARRLGPVTVNAYRIPLAMLLLAVTHWALNGTWIPEFGSRQAWLLAFSGFIGLSIGDQALFIALVDIGPRLTTLMMTTSPIFAAALGWVALGETLGPLALLGIALTLAGVGWVVLERPARSAVVVSPHRTRGVLMAIVGAACQAGGLLLSKQGMGHGWLPKAEHMDPQAATLVRMFFATIGVIPIVLIHRARQRRSGATPTRPSGRTVAVGLGFASIGAFAGPFIAVWLSLIASDRAPLGVAQTLMSLSPIFILPMVIWLQGERVSWRAALGAGVAVAGSSLLFV